jgi:sugar/nucleoside kinase (ribokinase family)
MDKTIDVLHVGILCTDIPLKIPCDIIDFTVDSIVLDEVPVFPGGDAANVAQVMARLGKNTALATKIGDDAFGHIVYKTVEQSGVDMRYVTLDASLKTAISVVMINRSGDRTFLFLPGSIRELTQDDIDPAAVKQARHVNLGSFFAHPRMDRGGARELFKMAKEYGATTSADVTHDSYHTGFEGIKDSLRYIDYFMPSYAEGKYLTGESEPERIADVLIREAGGDITVVLKMGAEGCFVKSRGKCFRTRAFKVRAVDTTGAGDNFVAGFLTGVSNGWELEQCAEFANAVAGLSVQHLGATSPDMSMAKVREFIKENTGN